MTYPKTQSESVAFRENFDSVASVVDNGGVITGTPTFDKGGVFDGVTDKITYGAAIAPVNLFKGGGAVAATITADSIGAGSAGYITSKEGASNSGWFFYLSDDTGTTAKLNFFCYFTTLDARWRSNSAVITYGQKHDVAVSYNSSSTANDPTLYVDGVAVSITEITTPAGVADDDSTEPLKIGTSFDGTIKNLSLYKGTKTAEEILDIYEQDTFEEIDDSKFLVSLPLRANYDDGANQVTENIGSLGGQVTVGDGATAGTFPTQLTPKGMTFDGTAEYLWSDGTYLDITSLQILGDVTFGGLVRLNSDPAVANAVIIGQLIEGETEATNCLYSLQTTTNNALHYLHEYGNGVNASINYAYELPLGSWVHAYIVRDISAQTADLYINGEFSESYDFSGASNPTTGTSTEFWIGVNVGFAPDRFVPMSIIQPRVIASALTPTQIKELANRDLRMINN